MLLDISRHRALRPAVGLLVAVALLGACGSDDKSSTNDTTTTTADEETTTSEKDKDTTTTEDPSPDGELGDACAFFDPADLELVTGLPFEDQTPGEASCVYTSSTGAVIAVNIADVSENPEAALGGAKSTCDEGTVEDISITDADGAFACIVTGVPTVAAVGAGALLVLTGDDADESIDDATILAALVEILKNAAAEG